MITYRNAIPADRPAVLTILKAHNLPTADIAAELPNFIVAERGDAIVGCIGLEVFGQDALVRSLAVDTHVQNQGVGNELLKRITEYGNTKGIKALHLLTTSAREYFLTKGFHDEGRDKGPELIRATKEFSELCPSTAAYMVRRVAEN